MDRLQREMGHRTGLCLAAEGVRECKGGGGGISLHWEGTQCPTHRFYSLGNPLTNAACKSVNSHDISSLTNAISFKDLTDKASNAIRPTASMNAYVARAIHALGSLPVFEYLNALDGGGTGS